ncbi:EAL domain-containing protein [Wenzhouxiangella sp. AB-CW3]|uniref:sensor domain-containing protein n=1 Tax=Wenzhouxiangella sp. AB-CW3 TaxID=2771012 RepID=UPI00168BE922|nr:EAL domain-containing protein [Wenzhouxiangella sp. AB-CW3]QOC22465.1 EAL domain-containing protein [Wenzhouxiangella sp. AB-CW3]
MNCNDSTETLGRLFLEGLGEAVLIHDAQGHILHANAAACRQSGYELRELYKLNVADLDTDVLPEEVSQKLLEALPAGEDETHFHAQHRRSSGEIRQVLVSLSRLRRDPTPLYAAIMRPLDEPQRLHDSVEQRIGFNRLLLDISLRLVKLDPESLDQAIDELLADIGRFFAVDRCYLFTIDWQNDTITNTHEWFDQGIPPAIHRLQNLPFAKLPWLREHMKANCVAHAPDVDGMDDQYAHDRTEYQAQNIKSLLIVPIIRGGEVAGMFGLDAVRQRQYWNDEIQHDLRLLGQLLAGALDAAGLGRQLRHMAYHDVLTQLPNRKLLADRIEQTAHRCRRYNQRAALMLLDIDDFKIINDTLTHAAGDQLLVEVGRRLKSALRESDTVARLGGDEFVLLCEISKRDDAIEMARRIMAAITAPVELRGQRLSIQASIGITLMPDDDQDQERLLRNADLAMYEAKAAGKNTFRFFEPAMSAAISDTLRLRSELADAVERDALEAWYQPIYRLNDGRLIGLETLVRWQHPERGMLPPGQFLSLAERFKLIGRIDRQMISRACRILVSWSPARTPGFLMAVNLSASDLYDAEHVLALIRDTQKSGGESGERLCFEITETALMEDMPTAIKHLHLIKRRLPGISIAIDDFGSGYSSLNYLRQLPVDTLKIDRRFIADLRTDQTSGQAIVRAIIGLAHNLDMRVVAEGIENARQYQLLRDMGCELAQGFLMGRPVPSNELRQLALEFDSSASHVSET